MSPLQELIDRQSAIYQDSTPLIHLMNFMQKHRPEIYQHSIRVAIFAERIATKMNLGACEKENLLRGCFLHDLGKIMLPLSVLEQTAPLSSQQWKIIKLHPQVGTDLLHNISDFEESVFEIILHHHERWDGYGYPSGLKEQEIPLLARICSIADAYDAMMSERPYRSSLPLEQVKQELKRNSAIQFDPVITGIALELFDSDNSCFG
ncbi:HD-GYP domain-containing protein [Paenibacillus brevis]|uniref:HD-GYP domain-containing protein n=1 Tax=Paenibacillus brevis TaxID=2841508 RepID=A0ABS6FS96_9BACL|nr:HD-GYP domain-containing protein [Paenibacillus brevis]MBU5672821.1 HD-GYP domain-containing protein [Paenibacillus brevis]